MTKSNSSNTDVSEKDRISYLFYVLTVVEGFLICANLMGLFFTVTSLKITGKWIEIIPSFFVMLQVPLAPILLMFFMLSTFILIKYKFSARKTYSAIERKLVRIHFIYEILVGLILLCWISVTVM